QLVLGRWSRVVAGALAPELGEAALDLPPDPPDGDAEDALTTLHEVDDLVGGGALVHRGTVAHERDVGEVVHATVAQVLDGGTDLLQRDAGVEEALDDLEHEDVAEAVETLRARAARGADRGLDEPGARPVVELPVGDAGRAARGRAAVAGVGVEVGERVPEQQALRPLRDAGGGLCGAGRACVLGAGHAYLLSSCERGLLYAQPLLCHR